MKNGKEIIFRILSFLIPFILFGIIELILHLIPAFDKQATIELGPLNMFTEFYKEGKKYYRIENDYAYSERKVEFQVEKPEKTFRVVCLGGSASAGWPHPGDEIYSKYLEIAMNSKEYDKDVEVINCSTHGFASYRIRRVFEQVIVLDPDALIIWSGNNEFLEDRNYNTSNFGMFLENLSGKLITLRLFTKLFSNSELGEDLEVSKAFWKKVQREALELRSDSLLFQQVISHYQRSIEYILKTAQKKEISVLLSTVPSNLSDWIPNVSINELAGETKEEWKSIYYKGRRKLITDSLDVAVELFKSALAMEPMHAETWYWMGKAYLDDKDTSRALYSLMMAKDLDYNPFRAVSQTNAIVRDLSGRYANTYLADLEALMIRESESGVPGFDLFLDYVHPSKTGNIYIAKYIDSLFFSQQLISPTDHPYDYSFDSFYAMLSDYRDEEDLPLQMRRFSLFAQNHQYSSAIEVGNMLLEKVPMEVQQQERNQLSFQKVKEGINAYTMYQKLERSLIFGEQPEPQEKQEILSCLDQFYEKWFPYGTF